MPDDDTSDSQRPDLSESDATTGKECGAATRAPSRPASLTSQRAQREHFTDLAQQYSQLIRSVARQVGGMEGSRVAGDVEQGVLTELWRQISREQVISHPASYMYRAAVRETVRQVRRLRRAQEIDEAGGLEAVSLPAPDAERRLQARAVGDQIRSALSELAKARRQAVSAHLAGFSVQEIMKMYGWSYHRARNLIGRGMADLRASLREHGIDETGL